MAVSVISMATNNCFTNKTFGCSTLKKTGVKSLSFEISRYLFASHEVQFVIIVNQYPLSYLIINLQLFIAQLSACSDFFSINNSNQKSFLKTTFEKRIKAMVSSKYIYM